MNDDKPHDLPSELTRLLRNVDGVHTVYATRPAIPTIVTAVVELIRNEPVGVHLVTVTETDDLLEISACIGVTQNESAPAVCRRAYDAISEHLTSGGEARATRVSVNIGRIG